MIIYDYDTHSKLVEIFIAKCYKNTFRKMLNMNLNSTIAKLEKKENLIKRKQSNIFTQN